VFNHIVVLDVVILMLVSCHIVAEVLAVIFISTTLLSTLAMIQIRLLLTWAMTFEMKRRNRT
jgi:hypothetical protein